MPSLNLSRLVRRNPDRPTLRQRAAALRATAGRVLRRPAADIDVPSNLAAACDWAIANTKRVNERAAPEIWDDERLDAELQKSDDVWERALVEPSQDLATLAAKTRMFLRDWRSHKPDSSKHDFLDKMMLTIMNEVGDAASVEPSKKLVETYRDETALAALEAEFRASTESLSVARAAVWAAYDAFVSPQMPKELKVWRNDWINSYLPRTRTYTIEGRKGAFCEPYGQEEVDKLRGVHCMRRTYRGDGEESPNGGYWKPDTDFQQRVDAIVSAWDGYQAAIKAAEVAVNLPVLLAASSAAEAARADILARMRETPARSLAGLFAKARVAHTMNDDDGLKAEAARYDPDDFRMLPFDIAGDLYALALAGQPAA